VLSALHPFLFFTPQVENEENTAMTAEAMAVETTSTQQSTEQSAV